MKNGAADAEHVDAAVASMLTLNRVAAEVARGTSASTPAPTSPDSACSGHAHEIAEKSGVRILLRSADVPLLPGARDYAAAGHLPGGLRRNREHYAEHGVLLDAAVDPILADLVFDPQTSGGLLFAVPGEQAAAVPGAFGASGLDVWRVGEVVHGSGVVVD